MLQIRLLLLLMIIFFIFNISHAQSVSYAELPKFADALNIEGGTPSLQLKPYQLWANLAIVLDTPLQTGTSLQSITEKNTYPLKESSIAEFNENQVNLIYLQIVHHYIKNAHFYRSPHSPNQKTKLVIHIHRNSSGPKQIDLLLSMLDKLYNQKDFVPEATKENAYCNYQYVPTQTEVEFKIGYDQEDMHYKEEDDIILSISLVAGLNPQLPTGQALIPRVFVPFSVNAQEVHVDKIYMAQNHLHEILPTILLEDNEKMMHIANSINSPNPNKQNMHAKQLTLHDFYPALVLQADMLFNPTERL